MLKSRYVPQWKYVLDYVHSDIKYIAKNQSGDWFGFFSKPQISKETASWKSSDSKDCVCLYQAISDEIEYADWESSLIEKPTGVSQLTRFKYTEFSTTSGHINQLIAGDYVVFVDGVIGRIYEHNDDLFTVIRIGGYPEYRSDVGYKAAIYISNGKFYNGADRHKLYAVQCIFDKVKQY